MKVICIDNSGMETYLTKDKEYDIEEYKSGLINYENEFYWVNNPDLEVGEQGNVFYKDRFKLV